MPKYGKDITWDKAKEEQLIELWGEPLSCSQIGDALGVSRSAIAGKVRRLRDLGHELPVHRNPSVGRPSGKPSASETKRAQKIRKPPYKVDAMDAEQQFGRSDMDLPDDRPPCKLIDLTRYTCRWPIGDPRDETFHYCGARKHPSFVYCPNHCRLAFEPRRERQRSPM